jgi:hypothetical protein
VELFRRIPLVEPWIAATSAVLTVFGTTDPSSIAGEATPIQPSPKSTPALWLTNWKSYLARKMAVRRLLQRARTTWFSISTFLWVDRSSGEEALSGQMRVSKAS